MIYFHVVISNNIRDIRSLVANGYCPVECSIDGQSIVDSLTMDHHGKFSHLEGVALRAYRDHFGARASDPRFVVTGVADADACFAIASLAGILPAKDKADLTALSELVNKIDTDPIGVDLAEHPEGAKLLLWNSAYGAGRDSLGAAAGVDGWRRITTAPPFVTGPLLQAAKGTEAGRRAEAQKDWEERGSQSGDVGIVTNSRAWGFDVWYGRQPDHAPNDRRGWARPVVIALVESMGGITLGCPNVEVAEALFGPGGLKNVFPKLDAIAPGWGGREAIGGSPRGLKMTEADVQRAAEIVTAAMVW